MKLRTVCLAPGRAAPGMTLAAAIVGHDGHTLLAAGTLLAPEMLDRLIRRGVETLSVVLPDTRDEETVAMALAIAESRVRSLFRGKGSPAREALGAAILDYRRQQCR